MLISYHVSQLKHIKYFFKWSWRFVIFTFNTNISMRLKMKYSKISKKSIRVLYSVQKSPALDLRPKKTGCSLLKFSKKKILRFRPNIPFICSVCTKILLAVRNTETFRQRMAVRQSNWNMFLRNSASFPYNKVSHYVFGHAGMCSAVARWVNGFWRP